MNRINSHKPTVNWNDKGWKIHQMKVIFHKCSLFQTPSQQGAILENDQEGVTGSQWAPYSLGRRDVPPDNLIKKVFSEPFACLLHRCFINNLYLFVLFKKWFMFVINTNQSISATRWRGPEYVSSCSCLLSTDCPLSQSLFPPVT